MGKGTHNSADAPIESAAADIPTINLSPFMVDEGVVVDKKNQHHNN